MNPLSFYRLSVLSSALFLLLAIFVMLAPGKMLASWGMDLTTSAGLLAKRLSAVYAGIAVMLYLARNAEHSTARTALIKGITTTCTLLALLGIYEFAAGNATSSILTSVFIESALVLGFLHIGRVQKKSGEKA